MLPEKKGYAEILNSSLKSYDSFSVCGRFLTYQFMSHPDTFPWQAVISSGSHFMLSAFTVLSCEHINPGCDRLMRSVAENEWRHKNVIGYTNLGRSDQYIILPSWRPGTWNTFCLSASKSQAKIRVNINGETVGERENYSRYYQDVDTNLLLLNNLHWMPVPTHGAVTDVNIWSGVLSEEEILAWALCEVEVPSPVLSWQKAGLHISRLETLEIERDRICLKQNTEKKLLGFNLMKSFDQMIQFCENLGGRVAVARDLETLGKIKKAFQSDCQQNTDIIHSGYSDKAGTEHLLSLN